VVDRSLGFASLPCSRLGPARGRPCQEAGWAGWEREWTTTEKGERRDSKGERKGRLNLASLKLNVLSKLC
jgi:hypothetical protein